MALFRSVALWPDCHHSQCSVWAETQVDNQQRNTVAWFKCWFRHSLAMWHWASYFPPLLFGFLLCVAGIIDDAYLLELMEWLKMKPVLSSVQWTLAVEVIKPSRLEWNHWTWFSYSVTNSWVYSSFHNPFFKWMAACQMALFHPLHLLSLEDCWIGSDRLWLAVCGNGMARFVKECICVCVCVCVLAQGPADWLSVSES